MSASLHPVPPIGARPPLPAVASLLESAQLPHADLTEAHMEHFFHCGPASAPVAVVGLELCDTDALLRSLVVAPARRSAGLGRRLVAHAESYARAHGARCIYLLTTTAEAFFRRLGYESASRDDAPAAIKATREFAGLCPASSAFLRKSLD